MASLSREVRNQARIKKMTYRIVLNLSDKDKSTYWVENAPGNVVIPSEATLEKLKSLDEKERPKSPFQKATNLIKEERELPSGLVIGSVETPNSQGPVTEGMAYVYYSPEGLVEKAIIQITNKKELTWSLIFNPITGHADIVEKAISLKDLNFE
jgi:general secretion pathway protein H